MRVGRPRYDIEAAIENGMEFSLDVLGPRKFADESNLLRAIRCGVVGMR